MKEKEQKLRDDFKGVDLAKTTRETRYKNEHEASLVTSVILATKRLGTNNKPDEEGQEGGPQRGGQGPATRGKASSTDQTPSSKENDSADRHGRGVPHPRQGGQAKSSPDWSAMEDRTRR